MDYPFLVLGLAFAFAFLNAGGALAQAAFAPRESMYRSKGGLGVGAPSIIGLGLAVFALLVPAFDVEPPALIWATVFAAAAVGTGFWASEWVAIARVGFWLSAAVALAFALIQAVGLT